MTVVTSRKIKKDGAKYFGPFMGGVNVNGVLELINLVYGIRPCDKKLSTGKAVKPCLNYHLKKCSAPCALKIDKNQYKLRVNDAINFLSGDTDKAESIIKEKMMFFANEEDFESALKYKELLKSLEKIKIKRLTSLNKCLNADVIACASNGIYSVINLLIVRNGRMLGGKNYSFNSGAIEEHKKVAEFISTYYTDSLDIPDQIIVGENIGESKSLEQYIKGIHNKSVNIMFVKQGVKKQLFDMALVNAKEHLEVNISQIEHKDTLTVKACETLKEKLNLKNYPKRIECYDISNVSGVDKVGSMVVFIDGEKSANDYRRFKIKTVEGADDYKSHQEMMDRRLIRLRDGDQKFAKPQLIVIDGGKGQLNSVKEIFDKHEISDIDLIALAEKEEEIYTLFSPNPIRLNKRDYALKLLIRIRDEAHRFAITYFHSLHSKNSLSSVLDQIKGLGKEKKKLLLERFKDLNGILNADQEQLKKVEGIGDKLARQILDTLKEILK